MTFCLNVWTLTRLFAWFLLRNSWNRFSLFFISSTIFCFLFSISFLALASAFRMLSDCTDRTCLRHKSRPASSSALSDRTADGLPQLSLKCRISSDYPSNISCLYLRLPHFNISCSFISSALFNFMSIPFLTFSIWSLYISSSFFIRSWWSLASRLQLQMWSR